MAASDGKTKIRYAVVGVGNIAQVAVLPAFEHAKENSELCALVSGDPEKLDELGERYGVSAKGSYDEMEDVLSKARADAVYIALPKGARQPKRAYPPLRIVSMSAKSYAAGIVEHKIDNVMVRIYDQEKTIADCFKFRNKIGRRVALEAIKDYLSQSTFDMDKLIHYAQIDRVSNVMLPYLRALTA